MTIMNNLRLSGLTTLAVLLLLLNAGNCFAKAHEETTTSAKTVEKQAAKTYEALKSYTIDQRNEAMTTIDKKLDSLDAQIDQMRNEVDGRWQSMSKATRENTRNNIMPRCRGTEHEKDHLMTKPVHW